VREFLISIAVILFRRKQNDPRQLERCGQQVHDDSGKEWPERIKCCDIQDLEQGRARPQDGEQIKGEPCGARVVTSGGSGRRKLFVVVITNGD